MRVGGDEHEHDVSASEYFEDAILPNVARTQCLIVPNLDQAVLYERCQVNAQPLAMLIVFARVDDEEANRRSQGRLTASIPGLLFV